MEKSYEITYHEKVVLLDIPKLGGFERELVKDNIFRKLSFRPDIFGKPLRQDLKGYRSLRVGDYRVVYRIVGRIVRVDLIEHRSVVYAAMRKRKGF